MFSRHHRKTRILFGLSDILLTAIAFEVAYQTRIHLQFDRDFYLLTSVKALLLGAAVLIWVLIGHWLGIYDRLDSAHPRVVLQDTLRQCILGSVSVVLLEFAFRLDLSRLFLLLFFACNCLLLCLFRWRAASFAGLIRREFGVPHYLMIVGIGEKAMQLGRAIESSSKYGLRLIGFLNDAGTGQEPIELAAQYPVYPLAHLADLLRGHVVDEIIFAVDSRRLGELEEVFLLCDEEGVRTHIALNFFPHVNSSDVYLDRLGSAPLLTFSAAPSDELRLFVKRVLDVALAAGALVLLFPAMALLAVLIKLTSPGPAIFQQVRCGLNGRRFVFYKFRSMCEHAEELKPGLAHLNQKQTAFKIRNDPRLTRIGRYIRKFSIDEWPQLWNVVKGDMSLVGPRPAVPDEVDQYKRWQRRRLRMRPGLTCLWAVNGRDTLDFETWMKLDMQYIDNWSLVLDWKIMIRTIPHVLMGKGAH